LTFRQRLRNIAALVARLSISGTVARSTENVLISYGRNTTTAECRNIDQMGVGESIAFRSSARPHVVPRLLGDRTDNDVAIAIAIRHRCRIEER